MKRIISILLLFCIIISLSAKNNHTIKAKINGTYVLPFFGFSEIEGISPSAGAEISYEYLPTGKYDWERHWMYPTIGVSLLGTDLGKYEFGQMIALYPYLQWQLLRSNQVEFGVKIGFGASFFTKTNQINNGAYAGVFLATGLNLQFNLNKKSAMTFEVGTNHTNNGEIFLPNYTMNIVYASLGYRQQLGERIYKKPNNATYIKNLTYKLMLNNTLAAGVRYNSATVPLVTKLSYHSDVLWKITNCYALGPGLDIGYAPNDIKLGITLSNAFTMGYVSGILDGGFFLYDSETANTTIEKIFVRAGLRYHIAKGFYAQTTIRTHIDKFDYIEFGLGYSIKDFISQERRKRSKRSCICAKQYR